jgi:nucleoside diphosphate kinase
MRPTTTTLLTRTNPFVRAAPYPKVPQYGMEPEWSKYIETLRVTHPGLAARIKRNKAEGQSLAFAWITPKSLARGLEGGILARLLSTPELNLIGTRMYSPSEAFVDEYVEAHKSTHLNGPFEPFVHFMNNDMRPLKQSYPNYMMFLLFTGENARQRIVDVIGSQADKSHMGKSSKTIRGSYGDIRMDESGKIVDFQPALVSAHSDEANLRYLRVFSKYAFQDGGILTVPDEKNEFSNAMVMIKPDSLSAPSARPGHIMDLFSSTGLTLIGSSVFSMSVAQAREFYGFLENIFERKLAKDVEKVLKARLDGAFDFKVPEEVYTVTTALLMRQHAQREVARIISFMTGIEPPPGLTHSALSPQDQLKRGPARCLALLYRGKNAIETVRSKLGSTDPNKALPGTVRFDYGDDVMRNGAHASDSPEALEREMKIIKFGQGGKASVKKIIDMWFHDDGGEF